MLRRTVIACALAAVWPAALGAQLITAYFGQNKVQYKSFDFKVIQTDHFDVHYYESERAAALDAARMAERSYARLSRVLNHRFTERKTIILYASPTDFGQTNTTEVGEGTQGVTDFYKQRNVLFLQGAYGETEHVLTHEMTHQFQYDVVSRGRAGANVQALIAVAPPLWFIEGMAEYLSLGPINPETAMWLRDAVRQNKLPTLEQLTVDYRIFPYRFGHAVWAFVGERWGDEAVGAVLHGAMSGGIEPAFRRVTGLTMQQLSAQWRDWVIAKYLPETGERVRARLIAKESLTKARSEGRLHIAPALSPDGKEIAYFSERDGYSVDMFLADAETGKVRRRLLKPTWTSNYETFRFLNSQANWSSDGKHLALVAKSGAYDHLLILEARRNKTIRKLKITLDGVATPAWSPDGSKLVFTGYDGGVSDLFVINADGTGLIRLTNDKYADLHPAWSPDGSTIAFTTDRGPETDFDRLTFGNYRIALLDVGTGEIRSLDHMDVGKNINPVWAPDGRALAFVSDRDGVSDIYLYELANNEIYQLTNVTTGIAGFTPLSPVMSWAPKSDRIAFMYYEDGAYDVYLLDNPRSLKTVPWQPQPPADSVGIIAAVTPIPTAPKPGVGEGGSIYRDRTGFRAADALRPSGDSTRPVAPPAISIATLLDSAELALPDTSEFAFRPYKKKYTPDFIARPSIGYVRDNFGNGIYGGTAISLSDMLGNHQLLFGVAINGRIQEAQVQAIYANLSKRINWAGGISQYPTFYVEPSEIRDLPNGERQFRTNTRRLVSRNLFGAAWYPLSRFQRIEFGMRATNIDDAILTVVEQFEPSTGLLVKDPFLETDYRAGINYVQPSLALVYDNAIFRYVGPFLGTRYRLEASQVAGDWNFTQITADFRRYIRIAGPVTIASRLLYFGRIGSQADQFQAFIGTPDLIRGQTSGSYYSNECGQFAEAGSNTGCFAVDRLVGEQLGVGNFELRFPVLTPEMRLLPPTIPPIEGAIFYDIGIAYDKGNTIVWRRQPEDDPLNVRAPLQSWGVSLRTNLLGFLIMRLDYAFPINRPAVKHYLTLSLGPTF